MTWERGFHCCLGVAIATAAMHSAALGQEPTSIEAGRSAFLKGDYPASLAAARNATTADEKYPEFAALEIRTLLETGKYEEAAERANDLGRRATFDPELALEAARALRATGAEDEAAEMMERSARFQPDRPTKDNSRATVAFAELLLEHRVDAKMVLERLLEPAKKADPEGRAPYLALGRLALANHDRQLAAEYFREGLKRFPNDPDFNFGLEQSGLELPAANREPGIERYLDLALKANPKHTAALLHKATALTGRKAFKEAQDTFQQVLAINPDHPEAWAGLAAIALVQDDEKTAEDAIEHARKFYKENPHVPEIIGVTLAGQYRFEEGIKHLEEARQLDSLSPSILFELGSNQLRFGKLEEGWENVAQAHELDPYNVAAFNLMTLRDKLRDYPVREKDGVRLRMSPEDMAVLGTRALDLAARAKTTLADKYGITLSEPVMVEMLPRQEDFAIRTFGLPGGESFLGVCFGPLITMTSPRGRLGRANWEAVLWHEMAHTITLDASRHRIPRWLSEGISVFEEREVHAGWGQGMNSTYRERFLKGEVPPITRLDESFAGEDIMLGYYHASLVVEFLVREHGIGAMRSILTDLSTGKPVSEAIAKHTKPIEELEKAFLDYAKKIASAYGPDLDWSPLSDEEYVAYRDDPAAWVTANPKRYAAIMMRVSALTEEREWKASKELLEKVIAAEPANREAFNPYWSLALACRGLDDEAGERAALVKLLSIDSNVSDAAARLLELVGTLSAAERAAHGDQMLQTNPFQEKAYRTLAAAAKESGDSRRTRGALESLLALGPRDAGRLHYDLATLLQKSDPKESRRQLLKALEENPRFQAALELLNTFPPAPTQ
ncbi:tetratricopeptide repeat protein [Luteolibacter arcticus]|uniref:Tetratricopeptide repeat protein n=1 Tax=Luteolibacter arcticus TaxID=1581411 RepID=A0ABT3GH46_9BACT|nr:tetratricopeptide repeat protein [Luteolibacter arcticus]MCW1922593.1 tetratricopeptide repeat protein [Luteolibacter arcticus]